MTNFVIIRGEPYLQLTREDYPEKLYGGQWADSARVGWGREWTVDSGQGQIRATLQYSQ